MAAQRLVASALRPAWLALALLFLLAHSGCIAQSVCVDGVVVDGECVSGDAYEGDARSRLSA